MKRKILYPKDSLNKDFEKKIIKKDKIKQEYLLMNYLIYLNWKLLIIKYLKYFMRQFIYFDIGFI